MNQMTITIVSGLPRSGTSLLMQMLRAGGMELLTDRHRLPDENNPRGYFEYEAVKNISNDNTFLEEARGKAIKIISHLLAYLPERYYYNILFMRRNIDEVILSQNKMLKKLNAPYQEENAEHIKQDFIKHLHKIHIWMRQQDNVRFLYIDHRRILNQPHTEAARIVHFLQLDLDTQKMATVIDPSLYRSRIE
ncbi:MAG TPA: sulfotransferase family protein [Caldithrix abyssi]|uniref:Sulfotransferase family protein n=1 Tax=Caldithrix abyssi TaxID=187145 RepID=A0A7V4WUZ8_CALAY|nr:sulfotransferase family protein [Caldithrix abyssi]